MFKCLSVICSCIAEPRAVIQLHGRAADTVPQQGKSAVRGMSGGEQQTEIHLRVQRFKTMIIANGTIETKIKTGGGIDPDTDYPIAPSVSWGNPIECQYRANKYSNKGKANGEAFTIASYEILIDEQPYNAEMLRLRDISGKILGEFSVIEVEPLQGVCQIRILV